VQLGDWDLLKRGDFGPKHQNPGKRAKKKEAQAPIKENTKIAWGGGRNGRALSKARRGYCNVEEKKERCPARKKMKKGKRGKEGGGHSRGFDRVQGGRRRTLRSSRKEDSRKGCPKLLREKEIMTTERGRRKRGQDVIRAEKSRWV